MFVPLQKCCCEPVPECEYGYAHKFNFTMLLPLHRVWPASWQSGAVLRLFELFFKLPEQYAE